MILLVKELVFGSFPLTLVALASELDFLLRILLFSEVPELEIAFVSALLASADPGFLIVDLVNRLVSPRSAGPSIFLSMSLLLPSFSAETLLVVGFRAGLSLERLILPSFLIDSRLSATFETFRALSWFL